MNERQINAYDVEKAKLQANIILMMASAAE
jgi:hypothetical protein